MSRSAALGCLLLLLSPLAPSVAAEEGDAVWSDVERVVAVGDVHGDCDQLLLALRTARVIDASGRWIGGKTHLVQTGDVLDRGPASRRAMDLLMRLEKEAAAAGGHVHALIGNHEAMILARDHRYVHPGEYEAFGGRDAYLDALSPGGAYGKWIRGHDVVIKINDTLFLHGGIGPAYAKTSLAKLNRKAREELATGRRPAAGVTRDADGPLWYRGFAKLEEAVLVPHLETILRTHGVRRVVVGHTVAKEGIRVRADGRVVMIDVGMSAHYGGEAAALVLEEDRCTAVYPDRVVKLPVPTPVAVAAAAE